MAGDGRPAVISVSLQALKDGTVSLDTLEQAFGPHSLGIIIVRDLPADYAELRSRLLSYSSYLANLPQEELSKVEKPEARYNIGWSLGRETLASGRFDTMKGSYYANPIHNQELEEKAREMYPHVPEMSAPNVWPDEHVLPGFGNLFEELCRLIVDVAALVARSCDRFAVAHLDYYKEGTLENIVRQSVATKGRLLHYFPPPAVNAVERAYSGTTNAHDDDWCATHLDLGALTGLTSNMFVDESENDPRNALPEYSALLPNLPELDRHPDPKAGLWIEDRSGRTTQVDIPRDCLAFQTGMALERVTRGAFKAVPHFVRGGSASVARSRRIARNTLAVFTQPNLWETIDEKEGWDFAELAKRVIAGTYLSAQHEERRLSASAPSQCTRARVKNALGPQSPP